MAYASVTGGRVWYEVVGDGPGATLILLHGGPGFSSLSFEPLKALGKERPVILYDQLGSHRSDHPKDPSLWRTERFVLEVHQLRAALGIDVCHMLGHSWGTMLLAAYLRERPDGVRSAVFSGPCLDARRWARDQMAYRRALPREMQEALSAAEEDPSAADTPAYKTALNEYYRRHFCRLEPWPAELAADFAHVNTEVYETMWGPAEFYATGNLKDYDATPWLGELRIPALFTCGRFDEATPESTAFYRSLVPEAESHVFESSAHMTYNEEPEAYRRVIGGFITRHDRT